MATKRKQTPMMEQYWEYRKQLPKNTLLLFRLGDFYEMFHEDAIEGSRLLGITLTKRQDYPMAGIPYHAAENYIQKLLKVGKRVAMCEQVETPQAGKLVKRELTRILTPGTTLEENQILAESNHYIMAIDASKTHWHIAWLDLSSGEFQMASAEKLNVLTPIIHSLAVREFIVPEDASAHWQTREDWDDSLDVLRSEIAVSTIPDYHFEPMSGYQAITDALQVLSLEGFGISSDDLALGVAGALVQYVTETLCHKPENLYTIKQYKADNRLLLDPATQRNLEIFKSSAHQSKEGSLMAAMDACITPAGSRLLERYLSEPLLDASAIQERQNSVEAFYQAPDATEGLRELLKGSRDLERIIARLQNRIRHPRELGGVRDTLRQIPGIRRELGSIEHNSIAPLLGRIHDLKELRETLDRALCDELPAKLQDGGCIREAYDETLDELRSLSRDNKTWISNLQAAEQARTGIKNLKIKYNGAYGYFIEVTKANTHLVPEDYIRKQTMTNAERFYTEGLKQKEKEILNAEERALAHEASLFNALISEVLSEADVLRETAEALAALDVFAGWSTLAHEWEYVKPVVDDSDALEITQGRHPVVEQMMQVDSMGLGAVQGFVPNDTGLAASGEQLALITGPNMAGKSTYIRQVALITLMAQVGAWVPAKVCRIGIVDRIFSRVGASDELARGYSTFMVEMNETANIVHHATEKSLVILDEIGRGTSTYDGLSIAWAVVEHLHGEASSGPRTLFATHYHELTQLENQLPRLRNYCVSVKEWNDRILFVRQVIPGAADRSYGIQVARLAGLPDSIINRAKSILSDLESEGSASSNTKKAKSSPARSRPKPQEPPDTMQLDLFA